MLQGDSRSRVVAAGVILPVRVWHVAPPESGLAVREMQLKNRSDELRSGISTERPRADL